MARPRAQSAKRAVVRSEQADEAPGVWITQLQGGVNYGVRDYGRLGKRATQRAIAEFLRVKHFVEVELKEIEAAHQTELLAKSAKRPSDSEAS